MILTCWEGAYRIIGWRPWLFPAPSHVLDATLEMVGVQTAFGDPLSSHWPRMPVDEGAPVEKTPSVFQSPLITAIASSLARLIVGFAAALLLGAILGMSMWRWPAFDRFLGPLLLGLQTLPSVCWIPVAILLLGINERGVLFVLVMGTFSAVALSLRDGLSAIPPLYPRAGLMLGASGWRLYRYVLLPASLPALAGSLRTGFSFAWRSLMGAEMIFALEKWGGLGFLLENGKDFNDIAQVVAIMIVMVCVGMLADRCVFAVVQRKVQKRFGLA
ncbi:MAG TPA: ABC transporter permease subunit [Tepidisphaeraceae bacterium]|jgi:NitT/TauT family transport system permease protein|nr:ABC transporter permease subunit [Tepidisphaeraceae bacterium]